VKEQILREYYKGFEKELLNHPFIKVFEFDNLDTAFEIFLDIPEFREFLGPDVRTVADIYGSTTHLATVEYVLDLMEEERLNRGEGDPPRDEEERQEAIEDIASELGDDFEPADIAKDASEADGEADEVRLTKLGSPQLKAAANQLRTSGIGADKIKTLITKSIADKIGQANQLGALGQARMIADEDAPILLKIGDEIAKILDGDVSNLRERKSKK